MSEMQTTINILEAVNMQSITRTLSEDGITIDTKTAIKIVKAIVDNGSHMVRGHAVVEKLCNVTYPDTKFISHDGVNQIYINGSVIVLNHVTEIKFFVSNAEWYDLIFKSEHGLITLAFFPKKD